MTPTNLKLARLHIAQRYMSEESAGKTPEKCLQLMQYDLQTGFTRRQVESACSIWTAAQGCARDLILQDQVNLKTKDKILRPEEISAIIDFGLHLHFGSSQIGFTWEFVEHLLVQKLNLAKPISQIDENYLPNSLWIEINGKPSPETPPYMAKTIGILMTKIPISADGKDKLLARAKRLPQWKHTFDMLCTLCECQGRCIAYTALAVQKEGSGFRFVPTLFGYDESGTVEDILSLHLDIVKTRKFKDIERFTAELCIRAIISQETAPTYCSHTN